eukprot:TRINITY_DN11588_c0_g2_i3.p1 TRINITY_DN11588_c0_g2~~TRINITY_DN11588_c0_g2_i3.p1  ORF type:complete len:667 (-),score=113.33 TRINITY_DN11588_c0_g2_i3:370-2370(-)
MHKSNANKENVLEKKGARRSTHRMSENANRKPAYRARHKKKCKESNKVELDDRRSLDKADKIQEGAIEKYIKRELLEEIGISLIHNISTQNSTESNKSLNAKAICFKSKENKPSLVLQELVANIKLKKIQIKNENAVTKASTNVAVNTEVNSVKQATSEIDIGTSELLFKEDKKSCSDREQIISKIDEYKKDFDLSKSQSVVNLNTTEEYLTNENASSIKECLDCTDKIEGMDISIYEASDAHNETTSFHEFTLKKLTDLMNEQNLSKIISIRERLLRYQEKTEKQTLSKMYQCNKFSPRTYSRKKLELEKWVSREKVEIRNTKKQFIENWKQTAGVIEGMHRNAVKIKQMMFDGSLNDACKTFSSLVSNTSRTINEENQGLNENSIITPDNKHFDSNLQPCESPEQSKHRLTFAKESEPSNKSYKLKNTPTEQVKETRGFIKSPEAPLKSPNCYITPRFDANCTPNKGSSLKITTEFDNSEVNKSPQILDGLSPYQNAEVIGAIKLFQQSAIQAKGIDNSAEYIELVLDTLFKHVLSNSKTNFLNQINTPLPKDLLQILHTIRANKRIEVTFTSAAIVDESTVEKVVSEVLEKGEDAEEARRDKEMYSRAICATTNEALNMLRPYGLSGEPTPWSKQQRILFKEVKDVDLIVKNVKSMVHFHQQY